MDYMAILTPVINIVLVGILGYIGGAIVKLVPHAIDFIIAKTSLAKYNKMKSIAADIWNKIEEDGRLGELISSKLSTFEKLILTRFPNITRADIDLLNKAIAGEVNKDKPVIEKELDVPVTIVPVTPIIKYVTTDGVELQPIPLQ